MSVAYQTALKRAFQEIAPQTLKAFEGAPAPLWKQFTTEVPSRSRSTLHAWLANQANVREWVGPRIARDMSTRTWEVFNKKWELTYKFERDAIDDDLEGFGEQAVLQAGQMGEKFAQHEDYLIAQALVAGRSKVCWDGQYFFDTDHPIDIDGIGSSGTYSNSFNLALSHVNYRTVLEAAQSLKDESGMPVNISNQWILMVPVALGLEGKQIVEQQLMTFGAALGLFGTGGVNTNPYAGSARLVINPYLTEPTRWYLMSVGSYIKPLIMQRRRPLQIDRTDDSAEIWFMEEKFYIGGSARYAASYAIPQLAFTSAP